MPQRQAISIDGHTLYYEEHSQGAETFVFIHGVTSGMTSWYEFIKPFKARGRVILLTLPGHYPAVFPAGYSEDAITASAWGQLSAQAIAIISGGQPVTLIGHSTGGFLTLATAASAPELVKAAISISGFAYGEWGGLLGFHQRALLALGPLYKIPFVLTYRCIGFTEAVMAVGLRIYSPGWRPPLERAYARSLITAGIDDYRRLDMGAMVKVFRAMRHHVDMRPELPRLTVPVLAITGDADPIVPPHHARVIADGVPNGTLAVVPGAGHVILLDNPSEVVAAIDGWLARLN